MSVGCQCGIGISVEWMSVGCQCGLGVSWVTMWNRHKLGVSVEWMSVGCQCGIGVSVERMSVHMQTI